jgi:uncharacterized protein (TIGR03083 family)
VTAAEHDPRGEAHVRALDSSVRRLRTIAERLSEDDLVAGAYPNEWSCADVLSHLGSAAVITQRRLEDTLAGRETPDDHAPGVWAEWNAKTPVEKRRDALAADAGLLARLEEVTLEQRDVVSFTMGPMSLTFTDFVAMRLNEHAFHTWDIEVTGNDQATLSEEAAELVIDNLDLVAKFTAKPTGDTRTVTVVTSDPARGFTIDLAPDGVTFQPANARPADPDLELPAEALARLVYGRLDPAHTPVSLDSEVIDLLRRVFPGP